MAKPRRNYARIAENAAILGAQVTGVGVPIASGMNLYRSLRGEGTSTEDETFVQRFLGEVNSWCEAPHNRRRIDDLGGLAPNWQNRLEERLGDGSAVGRPAAVALLGKELFTPLIETSQMRARGDVLLGELLDELPDMIVRAGDRYGALGALRDVLSADITRVEALIGRLDPAQQRAGDRALIAAYLGKLAARLNIDNWSLRYSADAARLDTIQQRLALADPTEKAEPVDVDELVERCYRLVILGGPGSGKSWSARRAVIRTAQAALPQLEHLGDEENFAKIELPLVATCAEVIEPSDRQRWERIIAASLRRAATSPLQARRLNELLAGHRRFLIVLDGLDEATVVENDALHELIDTYPGNVRVLVTSRPGSWNPALLRLEDNDRHRLGTLEPFTPEDRDAAVSAWLADVPDARDRLLALLRPETALSRQALVPLICALYCLVARPDPTSDSDPYDLFLPGRRLDLYSTAIRKLLAAPWRDRTTTPPTGPQIKAAFAWLEELAQAGNVTNDESGLGQWSDAIAPATDPDPAISAYVDNVAPPDPYSDEADPTRRFIHRTLREHLTATGLHKLASDQRASVIMQHLWFDPDWSEVIPTLLVGPANPTQAQASNHEQVIDQIVSDEAVNEDPTHALDDMLLKAAARSRPHPAVTPQPIPRSNERSKQRATEIPRGYGPCLPKPLIGQQPIPPANDSLTPGPNRH